MVVGTRIGRHVLERIIGSGGMGDVWQARDEDLGRRVAIKILARELGDESARRRFAREARILARLQHPNVVSVHDVGVLPIDGAGDVPYLVMECIDGRSMTELVTDECLRPAQALRLMHQVALALAAAHAEGVVHRDLKPSNVMVTSDQLVKVLDFGLARAFETPERPPEETLTAPGSVVGSCAYMAPEQALGDPVTPASDVFAFGAVLYELLSGRRAFPGSSTMGVLRAVARAEVTPLDEIDPELPPGAVALVTRCLHRRPEARFADGAQLAAAMERLEDEERTLAVNDTVRWPARPPVDRRRRRWMAVAVAAALAVGLAGGRILTTGEDPMPRPGRWDVTEVMNSAGEVTWSSWMPDGSALLASSRDGARSEIVRVEASGGGPEVIRRAAPGEILARPIVSPNGRRLAVLAVDSEGGLRVEVTDFGRKEPSTVIREAFNPRWLTDDRLLFTRTREGRTGIWVRGLTDGHEAPADLGAGERTVWDALPAPGRSGRSALVVGSTDVRGGLMVAGPAGSDGETWLDEGRVLDGASWIPGGRSLVAVVDRRLSRISRSGVDPLLPRLDNLAWPAVDAAGERISVVRQLTRWDLVAVDSATGEQRCLLCGEDGAGWGSTGSSGALVYRRSTLGGSQLVLRSADGGRSVITVPGEQPSCPSLSPDGGRVAYVNVSEDGGLELRVRNLDGSDAMILLRDLEPSEFPSWSPSGDEIAIAGGAPLRIRLASLSGDSLRTVGIEGADYPMWNPTGNRIAYSVWTDDDDPNQGLWVVRPNGGASQQVSRLPTRAAWSPDGRLLWQLRPMDGGVELWSATVDEWEWKRRQRVEFGRDATPHDAFRPFTVDPVTGELVFGLRRTESSLLVISGVDPRRW
jgi:hypothetical protein